MSEVAGDVSDKVRETAEGQKDRGAGSIAVMARAVHSAARELEGQSPQMARYAHQAADGIDDVSRAIKERGVGELFNSLSGFARRQPGAFFAGSVIAGVALSRFLKSSAPHQPGVARSGRGPMPQRPNSSAGRSAPGQPSRAGMSAGSASPSSRPGSPSGSSTGAPGSASGTPASSPARPGMAGGGASPASGAQSPSGGSGAGAPGTAGQTGPGAPNRSGRR